MWILVWGLQLFTSSLVKTKIEVLHSIYSFLQQTSYFGKNTKQCFKMKFFSFFLGSPKFYLDGSRVCVCDPCPKICTTCPDGICLVNLVHKSSYCRNIYIYLKKMTYFSNQLSIYTSFQEMEFGSLLMFCKVF